MLRIACVALLLAAAGAADEGWITHDVALSPDLKTFVRGSMHAERGGSRVHVLNAATSRVLVERNGWSVVRAFTFRGDGARFVATNDHGPLRIAETATGKQVGKLAGHNGWVHAVAYAGRFVASAGHDNTLRVWDAERQVQLWSRADTRVGAIALSPDGTRLATTDANGRIQLWETVTGRPGGVLGEGEGRWSFALAFSGDGARVAAGTRRVEVFTVASGKRLASIAVADERRVSALALSPDGSRIAFAAGAVTVQQVGAKRAEHEFHVPVYVGALRFAADGNTLAAAAPYGRCRLWDLKTGRLKEVMQRAATQPRWKAHATGQKELLLSIGFFDNRRALAVGGATDLGPSVILESPDGGQSWDRCAIENKGRLYDIEMVDRTTAYAVGLGGTILRTRDRGFGWERLETPGKAWLSAVHFVSLSTGFVVGGDDDGALVWKTPDGGDSWEKIPVEHEGSFRDVRFLDRSRGFAVGTGGAIFATDDGGATWARRASGTDVWLRSIAIGGERIHIAGDGVLLRSADQGRTWTHVDVPVTGKLNAAAFVSDRVGWLTGFDGAIRETLDGGRTWRVVYRHAGATVGIHVSEERLTVAASDGAILRRRR